MSEREYVLGTHDDELSRLGLQHSVWRSHVLGAWRQAGIAHGMTVVDVGAGPGFASTDLAELVGPAGRVIALEQSERFVSALRGRALQFGIHNIDARVHDVCADHFCPRIADATWCRWLLSFVSDPARTVRHIAAALKPGGVAVFHEYADYGSWRLMPASSKLDRFRDLVMQSWRDSGGEPDVALDLPAWLRSSGLEIVEVRPLVEIIRSTDNMWQWPAGFLKVGAARLAELGYASEAEAEAFASALDNNGNAFMMTPLVAQVIARKPAADYEI